MAARAGTVGRPRRVLIVNTADRGGGAERVAMTLLDGFTRLGTETWLAVGAKSSDDPRVIPVHASPYIDYRRPDMRMRHWAAETHGRVNRRLGLEDFAHWSTRDLLRLNGEPPELVLCLNLHGGYFDLRELRRISRGVPVVLRLSDSWAFTGHCAVPPGCSRWERGCGACPDLATPPAVRRDVTAHNWRRKRRILAGARLHAAAPSRWLMERARRSLLAPAIESWRVVPNGVDVATFAPGPSESVRGELGLDPNAAVLLHVCNLGAANPHKDFPTLRRALRRLAARRGPRPLELLVVGAEAGDEALSPDVRIRHLPYVSSTARLSRLYRAADLYVHAAGDEAFCLVAAEALACGTPVVAAASGGLLEVVDHERTGLIVAPGDDEALAGALQELLADPARRVRMAAAGVETARARYDGDRAVGDLHAWCAEIVAERSERRGYAAAGAKP